MHSEDKDGILKETQQMFDQIVETKTKHAEQENKANGEMEGSNVDKVNWTFVDAFICSVHMFHLERSKGYMDLRKAACLEELRKQVDNFLELDNSLMAKHFQYKVC